jgi:hypothetical protein
MERAVILVCFDDEQFVTARFEIPVPQSDSSAGHTCGLETRGREGLGCHDSGGSLSVRSRNANELATRDRLAESFRSPDDRDSQIARALKLRMVFRHRGCVHDFAGVSDVRRIVPVNDMDSKPLEVG